MIGRSFRHEYVLTDIQKGMIYESSFQKKSNFYLVQTVFSFKKRINFEIFAKAAQTVCERHEVLRSSFKIKKGYCQVIHDHIEVPFTYYDFSTADDEEFYKLLNRDGSEEFDLGEAPLMRFLAIRLNDKDKIIWTRHHILMGGASVLKIIEEMFIFYNLYQDNSISYLPSPTPYHVINDKIMQLENAIPIEYWQNHLNYENDTGMIPPSTNMQLETNHASGSCVLVIKEDLVRIDEFLSQNYITMNVLLQAAWAITLSTFCGKSRVVFGVVRAYPEELVENSVGLFINTLPVHVEINNQLTVLDFLQTLRGLNRKIREYVCTPLSKIKELCHLSPDQQLYQTIIDYKPYDLSSLIKNKFPSLECKIDFNLRIPYPIVLEVTKGRNLRVELLYDNTRFNSEYIDILSEYFVSTLIKLVNDGGEKLEVVYQLPSIEWQKIVVKWNETSRCYPLDKTIVELFEEQVRKKPEGLAIVYEGIQLTYGLLNAKANQFAYYLIEKGISIENPVAVCLKPGFDLFVCIWGILKAGGVYIPVDPQYPSQRIGCLLNDSKPSIIISKVADLPSKLKEIEFIPIDEIEFDHYPISNPQSRATGSNLMYIIYTSGSTGLPKGVEVEHQSAVNMALSCIEKLQVNENSKIIQLSALSFDVFITEWTITFLSGASLYLIDRTHFSPQAILEVLVKYKVSTMICAVSILAALPKTPLPALKTIAVGGEPVAPSLVDFWGKNRNFFNIYGITETTACSTISGNLLSSRLITAGKPLSNTRVYILDEHLQPQPIYGIGEIYIGGVGVARGYLNNKELNKERFLKSPFIEGERLYRTGDMGRFHLKGELEFLGRIDEQVKIRGFRVELTEIEKVLEAYPLVERAAAIAYQKDNNTQLEAYVLCKQRPNIYDIRQFMAEKLPYFMLPNEIFLIEKLPLTPNGKINKQKLREYGEEVGNDKTQEKIQFITETEQLNGIQKTIIKAIKHFLKHPISLNKNFMEMGLDSLMLIELAKRLSSKLERNVDIMDLFIYTNVERLAKFLEAKSVQQQTKTKPPTITKSRRERVTFDDE